MNPKEAAAAIRDWLSSEKLEAREVTDAQAIIHLHVKYPPTKQGHVFNIVIPKNRNLVLIYSITRVDEGQQNEMTRHAQDDPDGWEGWLHLTRVQLTRADTSMPPRSHRSDDSRRNRWASALVAFSAPCS